VASQWRIRHKLMLGLGLVALVVALLLAGTLKGLISYRTTTRTLDSKLVDLSHAIKLRDLVRGLAELKDDSRKEARLMDKADGLRAELGRYEAVLKETGKWGHGAEKGHKETGVVEAMLSRLDALDGQLARCIKDGTPPDEKAVHQFVGDMNRTVDDLISMIYQDCYRRMDTAKGDFKVTLILVLSTAAIGVLLMAGLLRFFYRWVFYPIRDLQAGVGRVAQGDFEHTIELRSGDEIEDLAAAFNDMTGRLREMYRDLARQVNERSRQLVRSERLASVGFLASGVAHEINNPLASIAFCSEALERRLSDVLTGKGLPSGEDCETVTKYLRMIQQEAFRCKRITQRLLEFSRGGEKKREPTDLGDLVQGVLEVVQHLPTAKGKAIHFDPPPRVVARVNAEEIKSVVLNLIVNALDSMDEGGRLAIALAQRAGSAEIGFRDTGCGMTAEVLENIFEPFFTQSRTGKGTGLGLSISHRIITQHQGEIEAASAGPGRGSTFAVRLPLQPIEEPGATAKGDRDEDDGEGWSARQRRAA
jgi:two-component system, NtrC family, sensor kinase